MREGQQRLEWSFRELVENSDDIFIVIDKGFRIRYISSSVSKLYGVRPFALLGRDIFEYVGADKVEEYRQYLLNPDKQSCEIGLEFQKGVQTYFDVHVSNAQQDTWQGFVLKLHDITKNKTKEKELIDTNKQLDQVIYKTTHDLKAPILSAIGLVNLAESAPVEQREHYLSLVKQSLLKLNSFIEEMNNFFRNEKLALQRNKIDIESLIGEEIYDLKNLFEADKINIETEIESGNEFFSDLIRVKTVITNLLTNAIKYSDPQKEDSFIRVNVKVRPAFCEITISDNGIGIEADHQEKIFDLFHRATTMSHGTGIGLFIVKDTIERLHGTISVRSEVGKGTTFKMKIPNQLYHHADLN